VQPLSTTPESWSLRKPAVSVRGGQVVSQHVQASRLGAEILAGGGNAIDAAVATAFAIGAVEPWMSGLGGCGYLVYYSAAEHRSYAAEFGVKSSEAVDPSDYPLVDGTGPDLFEWPSVIGDTNIRGPKSVAVPGMVAGLAAVLERHGTMKFADALAPAIRVAEQGMEIDWAATLKISSEARALSAQAHSAEVFLPGGFPPVGEWAGPLPTIRLGKLANTFRRLADAGAQDFYQGEIARDIVADAEDLGIPLTLRDLETYTPHLTAIERGEYRGSEVDVVAGLTAGPALERALDILERHLQPGEARPGVAAFRAYARSLFDVFDHRLAYVGDVPDTGPASHTTHLAVADRDGNLVALTLTLLSLFGSKVMLPRTGILMNNGMMWFDPRPGRPNSILPGKRPLSNMCPTILLREDGQRFALGASGGRRIMPAVFQLISFLTDFGMDVEAALHHPRLDISGTDLVTLDARLPGDILAAIGERHRSRVRPDGVYPNLFACPSIVGFDPASGLSTGGAFISSPRAAAVPEPPT
jgi:gamma-glutamyltranspeptidase/glutathione hydrolase